MNDAPVANPDAAETNENSPVTVPVLANDIDPDPGDAPNLQVTAASIASGEGAVAIAADGKTVTYNPGAAYDSLAVGQTANVTIAYTVSDLLRRNVEFDRSRHRPRRQRRTDN